MPVLQVVEVTKTFGSKIALDRVSLEVAEGEIVALLGPSGSGKSTLLYIIAGLETPDRGDVLWAGRSLVSVPPHRRNFGLMFQDFALFPHLNVAQNVSYGLRMARQSADQIRARVEEMLALMGLTGFEKRDVNTLSGGEQQRVALARSLAPHPRLLMLDEPLGSLDRNLRERIVVDLRAILQAMHQTAIYVTHDQEEAFTLADRVVILNHGQIVQAGPPQQLFTQPASLFVARFLGLTNLFPGSLTQTNGIPIVDTPLGRFPLSQQTLPMEVPTTPLPVMVLLRPALVQVGTSPGLSHIRGRLITASFRGSTCRITVEANGQILNLDFLSNQDLPPPGSPIDLSFDPSEALVILQEEG